MAADKLNNILERLNTEVIKARSDSTSFDSMRTVLPVLKIVEELRTHIIEQRKASIRRLVYIGRISTAVIVVTAVLWGFSAIDMRQAIGLWAAGWFGLIFTALGIHDINNNVRTERIA